jgi:hypothetical protein
MAQQPSHTCVLCLRSRKFSKPPIGPIGAHLTLTDTKWATAGEVVLGGSLELWIVHNAKDNQVCCCCCCCCCPLCDHVMCQLVCRCVHGDGVLR